MALGVNLEDRQPRMRERHSPPAPPETASAFETHYTPRQVAELWGVDESTIRRLFADEPGVLRVGKAGRRDGKRSYVTLPVPASVALRVHSERSKG